MPQSLSQVIVHFVFSTKDRHPFIDERVIEALHAYLAAISRDFDCPCYRVGGVADHVHCAVSLGRQVTQSGWVEHLKTESSRWMKGKAKDYTHFSWQRGYGAFSVSPGHLAALLEYIDAQAEHHQKETFQDEYRRLLRKYSIEFDERYVWG